jgi:UDP:flavonoid glycosyltransferase YjiC (YdhE family)
MFSAKVNAARRDVLRLSPYAGQSPLKAIETGHMPLLFGFSPLVLPKPDDWGSNVHVTGFWYLDYDATWQPSDELQRFLEAGPPPVYIGFGSMRNADPEAMTDLVVQALARARMRGILLTGWQGLTSTRLPNTVLAVDKVPHAWLFPRMAAVVHHGGAGTTAESLRAGVPAITVPYISDQPFWGRRIYELGVGPQPIPRPKLSVDRLTNVLCTALQDQEMRQRAATIGQQLRTEHGVQQAVEAFHQVLL